MENDSPNLFDSEPVAVTLTVAGEADDVLTELVEEINADRGAPMAVEQNADRDAPMAVEQNADGDDRPDAIADYHTDESDDEDDDEGVHVDDGSLDQPDADSPQAKGTKDAVSHKGLPINRVKYIMKMDPDVNIVAGEAVFLVTKATEGFVGLLAQHCHKAMVSANKKTLQKKHIDAAIEENVTLEFLEGALDW